MNDSDKPKNYRGNDEIRLSRGMGHDSLLRFAIPVAKNLPKPVEFPVVGVTSAPGALHTLPEV